eukprot:scaffold757_cov246-Pinguiococcus_pyrenoidosus.AAC.32
MAMEVSDAFLEYFKARLELSPHDESALIGLGGLLTDRGDYVAATEAYRDAAAMGSKHAGVLAAKSARRICDWTHHEQDMVGAWCSASLSKS